MSAFTPKPPRISQHTKLPIILQIDLYYTHNVVAQKVIPIHLFITGIQANSTGNEVFFARSRQLWREKKSHLTSKPV